MNRFNKIALNLTDAGCTPEEISDFIAKLENGQPRQAFRLLDEHRKQLLAQFHKSKDCIDCLDHIVFQIKKEQKNDEVAKL